MYSAKAARESVSARPGTLLKTGSSEPNAKPLSVAAKKSGFFPSRSRTSVRRREFFSQKTAANIPRSRAKSAVPHASKPCTSTSVSQ